MGFALIKICVDRKSNTVYTVTSKWHKNDSLSSFNTRSTRDCQRASFYITICSCYIIVVYSLNLLKLWLSANEKDKNTNLERMRLCLTYEYMKRRKHVYTAKRNELIF